MNPDSRHKALAKHCISDIQAFFVANKFRSNSSKTEIVYFHSRFISLVATNISHRVLSTSKLEVRNVRVVFDDHLTVSNHINK